MPDSGYDGWIHGSPTSAYDGLLRVTGPVDGGSITPGDASASGGTVTGTGGAPPITPGDATAAGTTVTPLVSGTVGAGDATANGTPVTTATSVAPGEAVASGGTVTGTVPVEPPPDGGSGGGLAGYWPRERTNATATVTAGDADAYGSRVTAAIRVPVLAARATATGGTVTARSSFTTSSTRSANATAAATAVTFTTATTATTVTSRPLLATGTTVTASARNRPAPRVLREEEDLAVLLLLA